MLAKLLMLIAIAWKALVPLGLAALIALIAMAFTRAWCSSVLPGPLWLWVVVLVVVVLLGVLSGLLILTFTDMKS